MKTKLKIGASLFILILFVIITVSITLVLTNINTAIINATSIDDMQFTDEIENATKVEYDFEITNDNSRFYINKENILDEIKVTTNTLLTINVTNNSEYETTLHFHGIRSLNKMDGVPGMTQDPILPNETFTYQFYLDENSAGTYMYHSHFDTVEQVSNENLYGGLVVTDKQDENSDTLIFNSEVTDLEAHHNAADSGQSVTINNSLNYPLDVENDKPITLHLINLASIPVYVNFGHDVSYKITSVDAIAVDSIVQSNSTLEIPTANRLTVEITNNQQNLVVTTQNNYKPQNAVASLNNQKHTISNDDVVLLYNLISSKQSIIDPNDKVAQTYNFSLDATMQTWTMNDNVFPNIEPVEVSEGDLIEITLENYGHMPEPHPFHLHGHVFEVVEIDGQKLEQPLVLDTFAVNRKQTVTIRFYADNPGIWAFHCHDLTHAAKGMTTYVKYNGYYSEYMSNKSYE